MGKPADDPDPLRIYCYEWKGGLPEFSWGFFRFLIKSELKNYA